MLGLAPAAGAAAGSNTRFTGSNLIAADTALPTLMIPGSSAQPHSRRLVGRPDRRLRHTARTAGAHGSHDPAILTFKSKADGAAVCVGTEETLSNCSFSGVPVEDGSGISSVAVGNGNVIETFSNSSGLVDCFIPASGAASCWETTGWFVEKNSTPSAVLQTNGNVIVAFDSPSSGVSDCELGANGEPLRCGGTGWPLSPNTSPSAVAESNGHVLVTFNSPSNGAASCLIVNGLPYACTANSGWPIAEHSNPSAVGLPNGGVMVAFNSPSAGVSDCELSANGEPLRCGGAGWGVAPNTSPSAVAESSGHVVVTFNSPGSGVSSCLMVNGLPYACTANSGWPGAEKSSPSAVGLPNGGVMVTFSSSSAGLSSCELSANGEPLHCGGTSWPLSSGSSPSAVLLSDGHVLATFDSPDQGAADCLIVSTPINCWGSGTAVASGTSPSSVSVPSAFSGALAFRASGALPGEDTYNWIEQNCNGPAYDCWATDTTPRAGAFGDAMRYDIATSLPTTDAGGTEKFGAPGIEEFAGSGGEYAQAGSSDSKQNLREMAQVTQRPSGTWEFNLGNKEPENCNGSKHGGNPCNVEYDAFPETSDAKLQSKPWAQTFGGSPGSVMLVVSTSQNVQSARGGPWHGFSCVVAEDVSTKFLMEDCAETWSDAYPPPKADITAKMNCGEPRGENSVIVWSNPGYQSEYLTAWLSENERGTFGEGTYTYSVSRTQLAEVVGQAVRQCPALKGQQGNDYDNWVLRYIEDGYEGGAGGEGAYVNFTVSNVHLYTAYQYIVAPPLVTTAAATSVGSTSATFNGTVNPEGSEVTKCVFEYGTTTSYGSVAPCSRLPGGGTSQVEVSAAVTGLAPNTTYDVRLAATNANGTETGNNVEVKTAPAQTGSFTQTIDANNSVNAVSCIPATTDCVVTDSAGKALYSTNVSTGAEASWTTWSGPSGQSPSQAVDCPSASVCLLADGHEAEGGNLYYATSLGGPFTFAYGPLYGVDAISCPSASFCVDGQDGGGYFRYSTRPASTSWTLESQGSAGMKGVSCLSVSFCAIVDSNGRVHVATSESQVKSSSWKETDVDGTTALSGVACTSTTSCLAVDGSGSVLKLAISGEGAATATQKLIDGSNKLTAVTCTGSATCVVVDNVGNVFVSTNAGESWSKMYAVGADLTSVSCSSASLCAAPDTNGRVTSFFP